jgi:hypothetical protein
MQIVKVQLIFAEHEFCLYTVLEMDRYIPVYRTGTSPVPEFHIDTHFV